MVKTIDWVKDRIVCHFEYWDIPLNGLIKENNTILYFENTGYHYSSDYKIYNIDWNEKCDEFFEDFKVAFKHCFYEQGKRATYYNKWPLGWFYDKWDNKNPIKDSLTEM